MSGALLQPPTRFEPQLWLSALTTIGGGYALMSGRKLAFLVDGSTPTRSQASWDRSSVSLSGKTRSRQ